MSQRWPSMPASLKSATINRLGREWRVSESEWAILAHSDEWLESEPNRMPCRFFAPSRRRQSKGSVDPPEWAFAFPETLGCGLIVGENEGSTAAKWDELGATKRQ